MIADSDKQIARYLDSEMAADERAAFEAELMVNGLLAARVSAWSQQDSAVRTAIDDLLEGRPLPLPAGQANSVTRLPDVRRLGRFGGLSQPVRRWAVPAALAASLAAIMLVPPLLWRDSSPTDLNVLDGVGSGQSVELADGRMLAAVLTFAASNGEWCREYAVSDGTRGIACRRNGQWQSEVAILGAGSAAESASVAGYTTAGTPEDAAIEEAYARLGAGTPLGAADEARVMDSGWTDQAN